MATELSLFLCFRDGRYSFQGLTEAPRVSNDKPQCRQGFEPRRPADVGPSDDRKLQPQRVKRKRKLQRKKPAARKFAANTSKMSKGQQCNNWMMLVQKN